MNNQESSTLYKINLKDIGRGAITAILSAVAIAVLGFLHQLFTTPGFDVFAACWSCIGSQALSLALTVAGGSFIGYITKNFLTDSDGRVLGKIG